MPRKKRCGRRVKRTRRPGGKIQDLFWGALFGSVTDTFGVQWMVNCAATQ
jgi:PhnB protein